MESPVVLDKPTDYHGSKGDERGFPFDEEESSGAWSSLAARHPDIAARLRQRPATWARKRRPSSQDPTDDFGDSFGGFDRFPFDDIPPEFREHFPSHWARRFEDAPPAPAPPAPASPSPQQSSAGTQTEQPPAPAAHEPLPQYGLRNTVDLGQRSAADPSVDAESRAPRSMSAPPAASMSAPPPEPDHHATVRHIPIFVEGRDEPVLSRDKPEPKPQHAPPPHVDRDQYFADDGPATFHHPPNFSRAFGTPFNKGFRQGPQPFVQQKVYPQTAFTRGASPQRSQSPKPQSPKPQAHPEEHFAKPEPPARAQPPPAASPPPPKPQPSPNDPITLILSIQTDVLNLMSEVENFVGTKKDKKYMFLDEMLTRNLIKLDNIETDGKENIRLARKEAIKCIQKCIAVLEAKAESNAAHAAGQAGDGGGATEDTKEEAKAATQEVKDTQDKPEEQKPEEPKVEAKPEEIKQETQPQAADTRPENTETRAVLVEKPEETAEDVDKATPKKNKKVVKKRDKSKDNKDSTKEADCKEEKVENMQVDDKGDKSDSQTMEVDGAAASQ